MRLHFCARLKYQSSTIILSVGINIPGVTYFVTSQTMSDPRGGDASMMWRSLWHNLEQFIPHIMFVHSAISIYYPDSG